MAISNSGSVGRGRPMKGEIIRDNMIVHLWELFRHQDPEEITEEDAELFLALTKHSAIQSKLQAASKL